MTEVLIGSVVSDGDDGGDVRVTPAGCSCDPEVYEGDGDCRRNQLSPANIDLVFRILNQSEWVLRYNSCWTRSLTF